MSQFNKIGGRYGMHSGSGKFRNVEVEKTLTVAGNAYPAWMCQGDIWYVDASRGATGDGTSWDQAFLTITEGIAALSNYDWLIIGPGNYDEAATIAMTGLEGVKILGFGTGMQWNEGSTCWRDVTSTDDLLDIDSCKAVEIAGISFINTTAKDAINIGVSAGCYSMHIHDCCFVGDVGGGAVQLYGINIANGSGPDTYIHNCRFFNQDSVGINAGSNQRLVVKDCLFFVPDAAAGIVIITTSAGYNSISDCYFIAETNTDQGIDIDASTADGVLGVFNCRFANCTMTGGGTGAETAAVECYLANTTGGALIDPT